MDENEIKMDETILDEDAIEEENSEDCTDICSDEELDDKSGSGILIPVMGVAAAAGGIALAIKNKVPQRIGAGFKACVGAFKRGYKEYKPEEKPESVEVEYTVIEDSDKKSNDKK